jgi:hypothetical protein
MAGACRSRACWPTPDTGPSVAFGAGWEVEAADAAGRVSGCPGHQPASGYPVSWASVGIPTRLIVPSSKDGTPWPARRAWEAR